MNVFEMIEEQQQKLGEESMAWLVGEQLKDICASDPDCAAIVEEDLKSESMSLRDAEKKISDYADELHRKKGGHKAGINGKKADEIIREFYGLPAAATRLTVIRSEEPAPVAEVPDLFGMDEPFPDLFSL